MLNCCVVCTVLRVEFLVTQKSPSKLGCNLTCAGEHGFWLSKHYLWGFDLGTKGHGNWIMICCSYSCCPREKATQAQARQIRRDKRSLFLRIKFASNYKQTQCLAKWDQVTTTHCEAATTTCFSAFGNLSAHICTNLYKQTGYQECCLESMLSQPRWANKRIERQRLILPTPGQKLSQPQALQVNANGQLSSTIHIIRYG